MDDTVCCGVCDGVLFWVDSVERYAICKDCQKVRKLSGKLKCGGKDCGAESLCTVKWISGFKP